MLTFKIVRKIGKMLRGGAGKKEIFLGALCGVLIGFNPVAGLTLAIAILIALLLNANLGFTLLGVALGKVLSLALSVVSFHTGYFIIHNMGLEGLFTKLANAPVTALMDLDVYAMVGSLPYAIVIGIAFGLFTGATITKIREQMVRAGGNERVGKAVGNKFSKFLMWLVFGKHKISTADVLAKESPTLRKSGLILVGSAFALGIILEFFLLDLCVKKGIQASIRAETGAEVNIDKAHLSLADGKLEIENLQITDPDHPARNLVQLDTLTADISISDLLRSSYTIDLLAGSTLKHDVPRQHPGTVYITKAEKKKAKENKEHAKAAEKAAQPGKTLDDYFAKAKDWKKYSDKANEYLEKRKANAEAIAQGEKPQPSKEAAIADAKKLGYLKASADLVSNRPAWLIHQIKIDTVELGRDYPAQAFQGTEVSSHPELNGQPTTLTMTPIGGTDPTANLVLRFDNPTAQHELAVNLSGVSIAGTVETSDSFPVNMNDGKVDIKANGTFSANELSLPFTLLVHDLKADVEEGQTVMGMDSQTATEVFSSMEELEVDGSLGGSLLAPRVNIDYEKLSANMKQALIAAGKKELANRANKEIDKAREQAGKELDKLMESDDAKETKQKAKDALKGLF